MAEDASEVMTIVQLLCEYLNRHPHASNEPDGIARWWLPPDVPVRRDQLQRALDWMQRQGVVEFVTAADGRVRYRRPSGGGHNK
jgi:hypothetical protein